jgi:hypothetical protein
MSKLIINRILVLTFAFTWGTLRAGAPGLLPGLPRGLGAVKPGQDGVSVAPPRGWRGEP